MPLESILHHTNQSYQSDIWPVGVILLQFVVRKYNIFNNVRMINKPNNVKNCYYINYRSFVNVVKYKLDHMRKRMETEERDATSRSSFRCSNCDKQFTDLEADQLFDFATQEFKAHLHNIEAI